MLVPRSSQIPHVLILLCLLLPASGALAEDAERAPEARAKKARPFVGWSKQKTDDTLVVRMPDGPPPRNAPGAIMTFRGGEDTTVEMLRSSWDELQKGDRIMVYFERGDPKSAHRVVAILRGGEKPLPPGLATRLFDSRYDESVEDVDGIGEVPPGAKWPPDGDGDGDGAGEETQPSR